ncbi:MAG: hypothetical protein ACK4MQ_03910 [Hyphomonas sp.]
MNPPLPPLQNDEDALDRLLGEAREMILTLTLMAAEALIGLARQPAPAALRSVTRRLILPAEAALRRAIILIAATLTPTPAHPRAGAGRARQVNRGAAPSSVQPRRPTFRLTEALPRPKSDYLPPDQLPRITFLDAPTPQVPNKPQRKPVDPARLLARLERRLAALEAATGDPVREARRWLRLRARTAPPTDGAPHRPPLAFRRIPGHTPKLEPLWRDTLKALNSAVFSTLVPDTS